jgi:uncharacterized protein YkwD
MKTLLALFLFSSQAFAQWVPAPPADPIPTPFPGPSALSWEVNEIRTRFNVVNLTSTAELDCAAYRHAADLYASRVCRHTGSDGSTFPDRARDCNTDARSQLIACGFQRPDAVIRKWAADTLGKEILLDPDYIALGSAHVGNVWVLLLQ